MWNIRTAIIVLLFFPAILFGQTAKESYQKGVELASEGKFEEAIAEYSKSIKKDSSFADVYSERASAYFALKDYRRALYDYTYAIIKNPKDANAIFNHAVCKAALTDRKGAIIDLDHLLQLTPEYGSGWLLRAQLKYSLKDSLGAQIDFRKAYELREPGAAKYLKDLYKAKDVLEEDYSLPWDSANGWKGYTRMNDEKQVFREILKKGENINGFTEAGTELIYKNMAGGSIQSLVDRIKRENTRVCPNAKITMVEYDSLASNPHILFAVECPKYSNTGKSQSQLIKVIKGNINIYLIAILSDKAEMSEDFINRWIPFLKQGRIEER